jgi:hypothetical protein
MNTFKQHIPGFVSGVDPEIADFNTMDDLINIGCVKRFMENPRFLRLSVADEGKILMAEYDSDPLFWCLGYFTTPVTELPKWENKNVHNSI